MIHDHELLLRDDIFTEWKEHYCDVFSKQTLIIAHRLQELPHFAPDNLASLIERAPVGNYDLVKMGPQGSKKYEWRFGDKQNTSGKNVMTAIEHGRFWISLQGLQSWDENFTRLTDKIFSDVEGKVSGLNTFKHKTGMLISSPNAQVYYHCDIPGQSLWQIQGKKTVYIYPNEEPFLGGDQLEKIFLGVTEEEIDYQNWFDEFADKVILEPGQMAHWPLNCPHRVENHDMVNISVTTEHFTKEIRDYYAVVYANGLLRKLGLTGSRHSVGAAKYAKMALAAGHKFAYRKVVKSKSPKAAKSFKLNLKNDDLIEDL